MLTNNLRFRPDRMLVKISSNLNPHDKHEHEHEHEHEHTNETGETSETFDTSSPFRVVSIEMIGTQPIDGVTYVKEVKGKPNRLPVLPSDHFGLLLVVES